MDCNTLKNDLNKEWKYFKKVKGALISFGVMCKTIAHSIQSHLLYLPAKFQGLKTNRTWATSNFLRLFKIGNYFCRIAVCDVTVHLWNFVKAFCQVDNVDMQDYALVRNIFFTDFFIE